MSSVPLLVLRRALRLLPAVALALLLALPEAPGPAAPALAATAASTGGATHAASRPVTHPPIHLKTLTKRAKRFTRRWIRAVNHRDWRWVRRHTRPGYPLRWVKEARAYAPIHQAISCSADILRTDRVCSVAELEVGVHRWPDGSLHVYRYAVYA